MAVERPARKTAKLPPMLSPRARTPRRKGYRRTLLGLLILALAVLVTVGGVILGGPDVDPAFAAPPRGRPASGDAQASPPTPVAPPDAQADAAPDDASPTEAIDLAVAPDGGVPSHPGGGAFRSPFSRPGSAAPVRVKVAMLVNSIDEYDVKTGTFTADFFVSFTSHEPMPPLALAVANGKLDDGKEVLADKPTFKLYRLTGKFKSPPNLRKYPFDSQDLKIVLEDDLHGTDQVRFSIDKERVQLGRGFRALGWNVLYLDGRTLSQSYPDRFEGDDLYYSRLVFTIGVERFATSAVFKVFVPAFVIVIISLLGMWVPPEEMEVRSNAGAPMLAGAVLFHFALMQELPATSYLTRADKVMLGVYVALALGMISTWWMFIVKEEHMPNVFRIARVLVPILSALVMAAAVWL